VNADLQSLNWRKSSASGGGNCVEVAASGDSILIRDTKDRAGAVLTFTENEWKAFIVGVHGEEFTLDTLRGRGD
jgi:predicted secreted Zn-dependent protease